MIVRIEKFVLFISIVGVLIAANESSREREHEGKSAENEEARRKKDLKDEEKRKRGQVEPDAESGNGGDDDKDPGEKLRSKKSAKMEAHFEREIGRPRLKSSLGHAADFPTQLQDPMNEVDLDIEIIEMREEVKNLHFRQSKRRRRRLNAPVKRWEHKEGLEDNEPKGSCGFPVCVVIDSRPKRFKSLCALVGWMKEEGMTRRVLEVQKGSCEDAIEGKGHDRKWISEKPTSCDCGDHVGCKQEICINDDGHAKTFKNVCEGLKYMHDKTDRIVIAVGLGKCKALYSTCLFTEWWDLDEPCKLGEVESVYVSNLYASNFGKQGRHRACAHVNVQYPAEVQTLDGVGEVKDLIYEKDKDSVMCFNDKNEKKPKPPYYWVDKNVTCVDFRLRYCCKNLWGEAGCSSSIGKDDAIVDPPYQKTLFDQCNWLNFMSVSDGRDAGDIESREKNFPFAKKSTCKLQRFAAMFIDARRVKDDMPWDETGEVITKNTPTYGFYCDNKNNKAVGKKCSDYKVRYCCKKEEPSQWGSWSPWSECSKSCGGGKMKRDRVCVEKEGRKKGCFNGGPGGETKFRKQEQICNPLPCPQDLQWQPWLNWSACSVTCGKGTRKRRRACFPPKNGGKDCPEAGDKLYSETGQCHDKPCVVAQWSKWAKWSKCSTTCGLGSKTRTRNCVDIANGNAPLENKNQECLGPATHDNDCDAGFCPVDGAWTKWQNWGECTVACGDQGKRIRRRYCYNPFPLNGGKKCEGKDTETGKCEQLPPCPQHCLFSEWGEWGRCSVTCGNGPGAGTRQRQRHIAQEAKHGGLQCMGRKEESDNCQVCGKESNDKNHCIGPCPVPCVMSEWSEWSGRCPKCYKPQAKQFISRIKRKRMRFVESDAEHGGEPCKDASGKEVTMAQGLVEEERPCVPDKDVVQCPAVKSQPFMTPWTDWSDCEAQCGGKGRMKRSRQCVNQAQWKAEGCKGKLVQEEICANACPKTGWTEWDAWSPCEVTCGRGQSARRRTCRDDNRTDIKHKTCKGIQRETKKCDAGSCTKAQQIYTAGKDATGLSGGVFKGETEKATTSTMQKSTTTIIASKETASP